MRWLVVLITLGGCRGILGIDDVEVVGPLPPDDAPTSPDVPLYDAPGSDSFVGCPADYVMVANEVHRYKFQTMNRNWLQARDICAVEGGYLAVPDTAFELTAIEQLAGPPRTWLGIDDIAVEGAYRNTLGMPQVFLPWGPGDPDGNNQDCVYLDNGDIADASCGEQHPSICECNP